MTFSIKYGIIFIENEKEIKNFKDMKQLWAFLKNGQYL
nr:MAG TPA: hypothetical protein [Caudoviricetes sp.]